MIKRSAKALIDYLIKHDAVKKEEYDLYLYATYCLVMTLIPLPLSLLIGKMTSHTLSGIQMAIPIIIIRKFGGGYHARKPWMCLLLSGVLLYFGIYLSEYFGYGYHLQFFTIIAGMQLAVFSPIDSVNKKLDSYEKNLYKKVTIKIVFVFLFASFILGKCGKETIAKNVDVGVIFAALLQVPSIIGNWKHRH